MRTGGVYEWMSRRGGTILFTLQLRKNAMDNKDGKLNCGICSYNYGHVLIRHDLTTVMLPLRKAAQYTSFSSRGMNVLFYCFVLLT